MLCTNVLLLFRKISKLKLQLAGLEKNNKKYDEKINLRKKQFRLFLVALRGLQKIVDREFNFLYRIVLLYFAVAGRCIKFMPFKDLRLGVPIISKSLYLIYSYYQQIIACLSRFNKAFKSLFIEILCWLNTRILFVLPYHTNDIL